VPDDTDVCPGFDDNLDADNDGVPDGCDFVPSAVITSDVTEGEIPFDVSFTCESVTGNPPLVYSWDFDGDGTEDSATQNPTHIYIDEGDFTATCTVTDSDGDVDSASLVIIVVDPTPTDPTSIEHYLSYKVKQPKGDDKFVKFTVFLDDKYESATYTVDKPDRLYNPIDKNEEGLTDDISHYVGYKIKIPKGDDKFEHIKGVSVTDQFGQLTIDIKKVKLLLVPSLKDHDESPEITSPFTVNHFKCYDAKESKGTDKFEKQPVTVYDPNFVITQDFEVKKPKMLCVPVDKNGEGFVAEENNLMCYDVKKMKGDPKFEKRNVFTNNQFGPEELKVEKQEELCVPSTILP